MGRSVLLPPWPPLGRFVAILSLASCGFVPATSQRQVVAGELNSPRASGVAASTVTCASMVMGAGQLSVEGCVVTGAIAGAIVDVATVESEVGQLIAASDYQTYCTAFAATGDCRWQTCAIANVDLGAYAEASRMDEASDDWLLGQSTSPSACDDALRLVDFDHEDSNSFGGLTASSACAAVGLIASADLYVSAVAGAQVEFQPLGVVQMAQVEVGMLRFVPLSRLAER